MQYLIRNVWFTYTCKWLFSNTITICSHRTAFVHFLLINAIIVINVN